MSHCNVDRHSSGTPAHDALQKLASATRDTEWEGALWVVGGAVRDALLGFPVPQDFDIVLEGDAQGVAHFVAERMALPPPETYPRFGTAMVRIDSALIEFASARSESYAPESRKPDVLRATLAEDAGRRDFTVNALMRNLHTDVIWDPLGQGLDDLAHRVLRTPRDPAQTFRDDPLRMLRAVRFRWRLGFEPVAGLWDAIRSEVHRLDVVSEERIKDEFLKMLLGPSPRNALQDLLDLGLMERFAPELAAMTGVDQGKWHDADVWHHTLRVVENLPEPRKQTLALAALLHDVGKPATRIVDEAGEIRFFGHEILGAEMAENLLRRLKFSNEAIAPVVLLVRNHMRLGSFSKFSDSAARRLVRDLGEELPNLLELVEADAAALKVGVRTIDLAPIRAKIEQIAVQTPAAVLDSPLDGETIMRLVGLAPGPLVGQIKARLSDEVIEGRLPPQDRQAAEAWLLAHRSELNAD